MGPHHPATHGVLRLLVTLEGEVVRDIKPIIGYVHTGIEKTAEDKALLEGHPGHRADGLPRLLLQRDGVLRRGRDAARASRCRKRAQYLRVIHLELNRIMSHLVWLGTSALDLGAISMFWYCFREREQILDLFEYVHRPAHAHALLPGRRRRSRTSRAAGPRRCASSAESCPTRVDQYVALLDRNEIVLQRLRDICPLDAETLLGLGVTGPLLRAAGNPWDLRKAAPYSSYDDFDFKIPVGTVGDNYDRYGVRLRRDHGVGARSSSRRSTACPRARTSPRTARSRCRRATSWRPRWRR